MIPYKIISIFFNFETFIKLSIHEQDDCTFNRDDSKKFVYNNPI